MNSYGTGMNGVHEKGTSPEFWVGGWGGGWWRLLTWSCFFLTENMACVEGVVFESDFWLGGCCAICTNDRQTLVDVIIDCMWSIHLYIRIYIYTDHLLIYTTCIAWKSHQTFAQLVYKHSILSRPPIDVLFQAQVTGGERVALEVLLSRGRGFRWPTGLEVIEIYHGLLLWYVFFLGRKHHVGWCIYSLKLGKLNILFEVCSCRTF